MVDEVWPVREGTKEDLEHLRDDSLVILLVFAGCILYLWWFGLTSPLSGDQPAVAWYGAVALTSGMALSWMMKKHSVTLASMAIILTMMMANACALLTFGLSTVSYLFIPIIIFAGLLFDQMPVFGVAFVAGGIVMGIGSVKYGQSLLSPHLVGPVLVIWLTALASWLSNRNLYTALQWAWDGYCQARHNEEQIRERQVELKRTLKALDEANYRIRRMNYQLALARERAEEARCLKQQFAANISHELRTPLNLIVGFSEMMFLSPESYGGAQLPPPYRGNVDAIYRSGQHLLSLIDDVLDLSQIEAGRMALTKERINLGEVIEEAVDIVDSFMEAKGLSLQVEVPEDVPLVYADRTRLRQVLLNLLNNSCRFTERGSVTVRVEVEEAEVVVSVADTGVGIPRDTLPHIFEEFYLFLSAAAGASPPGPL